MKGSNCENRNEKSQCARFSLESIKFFLKLKQKEWKLKTNISEAKELIQYQAWGNSVMD